ncbi:MAG: excalibur calcium-binding domain-containing protein [Rhodospirillaceae bacterium]|nr:excalibur calcium-binding domain-containing protein [Rhodospirillaceae bacterium]
MRSQEFPIAIALGALYGLTSAHAQTDEVLEAYFEQTVIAIVTDAYDGDTVNVEANVWPDLAWTGSVRVLGVDTPEIAGECDREKRWAIASRNYVRNLLIDETVYLTGIENDKYGGRVLANLFLEDGRSLTNLLIEGNYGRAYDGGERGDWCDESLVMPSDVPLTTDESTDDETEDPYDDPNHPLTLYDDNRNGRISCAEARAHGIAPVYSTHPAYPYMTDGDGDGVVCE